MKESTVYTRSTVLVGVFSLGGVSVCAVLAVVILFLDFGAKSLVDNEPDRPPACWVEEVGTISCDTTKAMVEIQYGMGPADFPALEGLIRTWAVEDGLDPAAVIAVWGGPVIAPVHSCESELDAQRVGLGGQYVGRITDLEAQAADDKLHLSLTHADLRLYRDAWRRRLSYRQLDALVFGPENLRGDW